MRYMQKIPTNAIIKYAESPNDEHKMFDKNAPIGPAEFVTGRLYVRAEISDGLNVNNAIKRNIAKNTDRTAVISLTILLVSNLGLH